MPTTFSPDSPHLAALERVVSQAEHLESQARRLEADRLQLFASALEVALAEQAHLEQARRTRVREEANAAARATGATTGNTNTSATDTSTTHSGTAAGTNAGTAASGDAGSTDHISAAAGRASRFTDPPADLPYRSLRAELAAALRLSEATIERKLSHAHTLTTQYPLVFESLRDGYLSERHTTVIVEAGRIIGDTPDEDTKHRRACYEIAVLEAATEMTPARLAPVARRLAEQYAHTSIDERHEIAATRRRVYVQASGDGMADLYAHLPAVEAYGIYDRLTRMSKHLAQTEAKAKAKAVTGDTGNHDDGATKASEASAELPLPRRRTRDEIRTDLFTDLLLNSTLSTNMMGETGETDRLAGIQAHVSVLVPDLSLVGLTHTGTSTNIHIGTGTGDIYTAAGSEIFTTGRQGDSDAGTVRTAGTDTDDTSTTGAGTGNNTGVAPVELLGYGPIPTAPTRTLLGEATIWSIATYDPLAETLLMVDRYRPTEEIRRFLIIRDEHCRFPGCRASIFRCDLDHTHDAADGGDTTTANLGYLCRSHHMLKHHGGWKAKQKPGGEYQWESPTGRTYIEPAPSKVRFTSTTSPPVPY